MSMLILRRIPRNVFWIVPLLLAAAITLAVATREAWPTAQSSTMTYCAIEDCEVRHQKAGLPFRVTRISYSQGVTCSINLNQTHSAAEYCVGRYTEPNGYILNTLAYFVMLLAMVWGGRAQMKRRRGTQKP